MADDVRVKLSAEGVDEVVDAMKRIREEAKETGEEGAEKFEAFKEAIEEVGKSLFGFLALEKVLDSVKDMFKETFESAEKLATAATVTGLSTDALQALGAAAKETDVDQKALNKGLETFARTIGDAEAGSKKATQGFSQLGISLKDLKDMKPDDQLKLVAQKLNDIEKASDRASVGAKLFGKSFEDIEPVINELAEKGYGEFLKKLRELGVYLDGDTIKQLNHAKEATKELGEEVKGLATQFLIGLLPAAQRAIDGMVEDTTGNGVNGFKTLGEYAGKVFEGIVAGFRLVGAAAGQFAAQMQNAFSHPVSAVKDNLIGAANWIKNEGLLGQHVKEQPDLKAGNDEYSRNRDAMWDSFQDQLNKILDEYGRPPKQDDDENKRKNFIPKGIDQNTQALAQARLAFIEAQLNAEQKLYEAHLKLLGAEDKEAADKGKISLEQQFKDRANLIKAQYSEEISILERRKAAIAAMPIDANDNGAAELQKRAQLATVDGDIAAKREERETALVQLANERAQALRQLHQEELAAQQKLLEIEGKKADAQRLQLQLETEKLKLDLQKSGKSSAEIDAAVATFNQQANAKIDFTDAKTQADAAIKALNTQIASIQDKVKDGTLFPVQAEEQITALEEKQLPVLEQLANKLAQIAAITKDPTVIEQAEQFKQKIDDLKVATDDAGQAMAALKQTAQNALQNGISGLLTSIASGTVSVSQAFRKMGYDIAASLVKLEADFLAKKFVQWLLSGPQATQDASQSTQGVLGQVGNWIGNLFSGGGQQNVQTTTTTTANTTAVTANTTAQTALTTANTTLGGLISALTAAVTANTTAISTQQAGGSGGGLSSLFGSQSGGFTSFLSGGGGDAVGAGADSADAAVLAAGGGFIRGPGTSTSDSIPAMLSDGEFVVNAAAVNKPGIMNLLHAINGTPGYAKSGGVGVRRYAEGGLVSGGGIMQNHYHVDASGIPQHIIQASVNKAVLDVIAKHPTKVRNSIGG